MPGRLGFIAWVVSSRPFGVLGVYSGFLAWITARFSRRTGRYTAKEREAIAAPLRRWSSRRALAEVLRSLRTEHAFLARLESSLQGWLPEAPVLLLYGSHDNGYRAGFAERWSQMCPNSRLVVLEESGHFPLEDEPNEWIRSVEEFLANEVARFALRIRAA
jgi:pimeloyl-ACP methyl ester carboxylesterase